MIDLDAIPYIAARDQSARPAGYRLKWITIHDMEAPETLTTAEGTANYFRSPPVTASAHYCCDADSIVCCVKPERRAVHAAGLNNEGIGIEQAGYASQSGEEWLDGFSRKMIVEQVAPLVAALCDRYQIPCTYVGVDGLKRGEPGIVTHWDSTKAFNVAGGHTDPGPNYPMWLLVQEAQRLLGHPTPEEDEMPLELLYAYDAVMVYSPSANTATVLDTNEAVEFWRFIAASEPKKCVDKLDPNKKADGTKAMRGVAKFLTDGNPFGQR